MITFEGEGVAPEKLPKPSGWRILVGPIKIMDTTEGGILLTLKSVEEKEYLRYIGKILAVGSDCYRHTKFQGGVSIETRTPTPWAKVGDIVIVGQYAGQTLRVKSDGEVHSLKLLNDDEILAVVPNVDSIDV